MSIRWHQQPVCSGIRHCWCLKLQQPRDVNRTCRQCLLYCQLNVTQSSANAQISICQLCFHCGRSRGNFVIMFISEKIKRRRYLRRPINEQRIKLHRFQCFFTFTLYTKQQINILLTYLITNTVLSAYKSVLISINNAIHNPNNKFLSGAVMHGK